MLTVDNMKRLGFRSASVSTEEKVGLKNRCSQTIESLLFYIVCYRLDFGVPHLSPTVFFNGVAFHPSVQNSNGEMKSYC